jgi:hypothetical protein
MIIYAEDLGPIGVTVDDLMAGGKALEKWPQLEKALVGGADQFVCARSLQKES